jgi:polyisoprenoid-binding protein YceI
MKKMAVAAGIMLLGTVLVQGQQARQIDGEKSQVNFSIKNLNIRTVTGTFKGMQGEIRFDESDLGGSFFRVSIDPANVNTGNKKRDKHLRSESFFHVEAHPLASFSSSSIRESDEGYSTKGTLTIRGVSREVEIPFTYNQGQFTGTLQINRLDYEVGEGTGFFTAGETASVEIIAALN